MRVRGLKLYLAKKVLNNSKSHPMRVRGLKHDEANKYFADMEVAPHAGAWIETVY